MIEATNIHVALYIHILLKPKNGNCSASNHTRWGVSNSELWWMIVYEFLTHKAFKFVVQVCIFVREICTLTKSVVICLMQPSVFKELKLFFLISITIQWNSLLLTHAARGGKACESYFHLQNCWQGIRDWLGIMFCYIFLLTTQNDNSTYLLSLL